MESLQKGSRRGREIERETRGMYGVKLLVELGQTSQRDERNALPPGGGRQNYCNVRRKLTGCCDICAGPEVARGIVVIGGGGHAQKSIVGEVVLAQGRREGAGLAPGGDPLGADLARGREGVPLDGRRAGLVLEVEDGLPGDRGAGVARDPENAGGGLIPGRDDVADHTRGRENGATPPPVNGRDEPQPPDSSPIIILHNITNKLNAEFHHSFFL